MISEIRIRPVSNGFILIIRYADRQPDDEWVFSDRAEMLRRLQKVMEAIP